MTDEESIPTGEIRSVANSIMDLRIAKRLGDVIDKVPGGGYDYNFCVPEDDGPKGNRFIARAEHPNSGRYLEVYSDQPGVQLYTSNFIPDETTQGILGKSGQKYFKHGAFCLETQNYPDAVNHVSTALYIFLIVFLYSNCLRFFLNVKNQKMKIFFSEKFP